MRSRTPLFAAVVFVVLFGVATALIPSPPHVEDSGQKVVNWLNKHHDDVPIASQLFLLAVIPFLVLVAWTRRALPALHGYAFLAAAGAFVGQAMIGVWITAALALHSSSVAPETARTLMDVSSYFGPVLTATDVVLAGAVALAVFGHNSLPRPVGVISLVFAVEQLAESFTVYGSKGFAAPGGDWNADVGGALFAVWIVTLGVGLALKGRGDEAAAA